MPTRQGRHFDRHIRVDEAGGNDTRGYYAAEHMKAAVDAYIDNDFDALNEELGFALHCLQDASAHGNIDVNTWACASHATITGVDSANYEWTDNDDREQQINPIVYIKEIKHMVAVMMKLWELQHSVKLYL